jgi:hypothetical protein
MRDREVFGRKVSQPNWDTISAFRRKDEKKHQKKIVSIVADAVGIWNMNLPNACVEPYCYVSFLGSKYHVVIKRQLI